jgi:hypothetical protein
VIDPLVWLLIIVIVGAVVVYLLYRIITLLPFDQPVKNIILAIALLIVLLLFLRYVGAVVPLRPPAGRFDWRAL